MKVRKMRNSLRKMKNFWRMMKILRKIQMPFLMKKRGKMNFTKMKVHSRKKNLMRENFPVLNYPMSL
jgi:hypothetical protein